MITNMAALSKDMIDNQLFSSLDIKEAAILHKYITAAGNQINADDAGKSAAISLSAIYQHIAIDVHRDEGYDCHPAAAQDPT